MPRSRPPRKKLAARKSATNAAPVSGIVESVKIQWRNIIAIISAFGAVIAFTQYAFAPFALPTITSDGETIGNPFAIPFTVTNRSPLFRMDDVKLNCHFHELYHTIPVDPELIKDENISFGGFSISANDNLPIRCAAEFGPIVQAHIFLTVDYTILRFWHRTSPSFEFTWSYDRRPGRWEKGDFQ